MRSQGRGILYHETVGRTLVRGLERYRTPLLILWGAGLLVTGYFSLLPGKTLGTIPGSDKLWHCGGYLLMALPVSFLCRSTARRIQVAAALIAYGILLEFLQGFVPGRSVEGADVLANSAGVILGIGLPELLRSLPFGRPLKVGTD